MSQQTSDYLAKKLRQNWLMRYQELKIFNDQEDDDSLTNLAWLQNLNLTKMVVPGAKINLSISPPWTSPEYNNNLDEKSKDSGFNCAGEKTFRNTIELYRQHCNNYGFSMRRSAPQRPQSTNRSLMTRDFLNFSQSKQQSSWWKFKGHRSICRKRCNQTNQVKFPLTLNNSCSIVNYQLTKPEHKENFTTVSYPNYTANNGTPSIRNARMRDDIVLDENFSPKSPNNSCLKSYCVHKNCDNKRDLTQFEDLSLNCNLPTLNDIDPDERVVYKHNQTARPPYSYTELIYMCMDATKKAKSTLNEIYTWIADNFTFYKNSEPAWKLALRQTLIKSNYFQRVPRRKEEPGGWGDMWRLNPILRTHSKCSTQDTSLQQSSKDKNDFDPDYNLKSSIADSFEENNTNNENSDIEISQCNSALSPSNEYWVNEHNSTSSTSSLPDDFSTPSSVRTSEDGPISRIFDSVPEDVPEDVLEKVMSISKAFSETIRSDCSSENLREIDVLLSDKTENAAEMFPEIKTCSQSPRRTEDSISKFKFTCRGEELKSTMDWWPDDISESVTNFIDNLSSFHELSNRRLASELLKDNSKNFADLSHIANFPDLQTDYVNGAPNLSDEHPWVDDRLNLEELNSILGLN